MGKELKLDIPGATSDVADLRKALGILQNAGTEQLESYKKLAGAVQGTGMDTATEFSQKQNAAITSVHDVVNRCCQSTDKAIQETIGYDRGIAGGKMTGA
ncbi:hypothetical protein ACT17_06485 [Mycolicibacterium conceptionense]|uniref:Uncharacterized protein n=1 Tax=Mycolicibacterium conceptionense TaxID=451644 RepID=A0A0J8X2L1_9MYCO|nr:hypothetical protein [Mycolicibacterium conceptionense]KMV19674.1 hypothetical protein ACT17_06485 [Mycolicibacterium conceptionense]